MKKIRMIPLILGCLFIGNVFAADPMAPIKLTDYKTQPIKVACVGDSITYTEYPAKLQALLGRAWKVDRWGFPGCTLLSKGDSPWINVPTAKEAYATNPDIVLIMLGTNDTKQQNWAHKADFDKDYKAFIKSWQDLPSKPRIYICRPCPAPGPGNFGITDRVVKDVIRHVNRIAAATGVGLIDMNEPFKGNDKLFTDHVHPTLEGQDILAKTAYKALIGKEAPAAP